MPITMRSTWRVACPQPFRKTWRRALYGMGFALYEGEGSEGNPAWVIVTTIIILRGL
jgi:hypothetical protein